MLQDYWQTNSVTDNASPIIILPGYFTTSKFYAICSYYESETTVYRLLYRRDWARETEACQRTSSFSKLKNTVENLGVLFSTPFFVI